MTTVRGLRHGAAGLRSGLLRFAALLCAGVALGGCVDSQREEASGKGSIRAVHAAPSATDVTFLIEERSLGELGYKTVTSAQPFDDLSYNFNFDARLPGDTSLTRIATETVDVVAGTDYLFALTGTLASPSVVLWETEQRVWEGGETVFEVWVGHLAEAHDEVDVYFAESGTAPAAGNARGTLSFGERLEPFEVESGDYKITVTEAGNPAAVLFASSSRDYAERISSVFTIHDADPSITSALSVRRTDQGGNSVEVADPAYPPTRRIFNAAFGSGSMDVWLDDDFVTPLVSNLAYGSVSADVALPAGESTYTYTAAGNPGAILLEDDDTVTANTRGINFVVGEPDDLEVVVLAENRRPVTGFGKVRLTQLSVNFELVDGYLLPEGTDIADGSPNLARLAQGTTSGYLNLAPGSYELTLTETGEKTVVAGPLPVTLNSGSIEEIAIIDTADPNLLDVVNYN